MMDDLRQRFATLDRVPVPDVWTEVERRAEAMGGPPSTRRLAAVRPEWRGALGERSRPLPTRTRSRRAIVLLVAAALIVAALGGALAVGSGLVRLTSVALPSLAATPLIAPAPSPAEASPSRSSVAPSSSSVAPSAEDAFPARTGMFDGLRDSLLASDTIGWVATSSAIYRTTDKGQSWTQVRSPRMTTTSVTAFVDPDTMYLASGTSPATIAATHDGGASWVEVDVSVGVVSGGPVFSFQSPQQGFATFYDPNGTEPLLVYGTTDGGVTWNGPADGSVPHMAASFDKLNAPIGGFLWQSAGKFDNKPFDNRFFLSADGAVTWKQYTFPFGSVAPKNALKTIADIVTDGSGRITVAINADGGQSSLPTAIYQSTDDPAAWQLVRKLPVGFELQLLSPTVWVLVGVPSEIRSTVDAGEHWRTTTSSTPFRATPQFATADDGWLIANCAPTTSRPRDPFCDSSSTSVVLADTSDGGATWTRLVR